MKLDLEISDELFELSTAHAELMGISLSSLIEQGLTEVLDQIERNRLINDN